MIFINQINYQDSNQNMYANHFESSKKLAQASKINPKRPLKPPMMSKSYSHFNIGHEVSSPFSIYSKDHKHANRKISEQMDMNQLNDDLKYYIPSMSDRMHNPNSNPNIMKNYSLYKPSERDEKMIQFENIKKNRFKKISKSKKTPKRGSKNIVISKTQSRTMVNEKYDDDKFTDKYNSYRPVDDSRNVSSTQNSFQRKISSSCSDSKKSLYDLLNKDFSQMNTKEMKLIFSLLDSKKLGYINKKNSNFSAIPSNLMIKMKGLIKTVISTDEPIDFESFLHLVYK